jgi:hypothetical protein
MGLEMTSREREERLQIMLAQEELKAIDDFRFKFRLPSRAAAIRELLKRGLSAADTGPATSQSRSKDFGVLDTHNGSSFEQNE